MYNKLPPGTKNPRRFYCARKQYDFGNGYKKYSPIVYAEMRGVAARYLNISGMVAEMVSGEVENLLVRNHVMKKALQEGVMISQMQRLFL